MAVLVNPSNNHRISTDLAFLWCILFGCFYLLYKGLWGHAILAFFLAGVTAGISWLIYPFLAKSLIINHYMKAGYQLEE